MKTILVTGSTDGIGKATGRSLVRTGSRSHRPWDATKHGTGRQPHGTSSDATATELRPSADFSLGHQVGTQGNRKPAGNLTFLINNAASPTNHRTLTEDGFESTFGINHLAPFLLTNLLLDLLQDSAPARIVNVSSGAHTSGHIDLDDLHMARNFDGWGAYCNSKLANALFTCELASKLAPNLVTANFLHPGVIETKLLHVNFSGGSPVESGAETPVHLALAPEVAGNGRYFVNRQQASAQGIDDRHLAAELVAVSTTTV